MELSQGDAMTIQKAPKSPPLAFQQTSNDALWSPFNPITLQALSQASSPYLVNGNPSDNEMELQLEKLNDALRLQNQAFVAERESWQMERDRLHRRITALESLLKVPNGQSPARSPAISPQNGPNHSISPSRPPAPSIAHVAPGQRSPETLRIKRDCAPVHIDLPSTEEAPLPDTTAPPSDVLRPDIPASPPVTRQTLSPPPLANRHLAGHTPLKAPRPGDFSPAMSVLSEKLSDTPTRSNTLLNESMADGVDEDRPLKGPLHMPSLPCNPGQENFTMDMLDAKLQDIVEHPDENQPIVLKAHNPADEAPEVTEASPTSTDSRAPKVDSATESKDKKGTDNGGIRLRTKPSSNFGAPLGQLGHGSWRR